MPKSSSQRKRGEQLEQRCQFYYSVPDVPLTTEKYFPGQRVMHMFIVCWRGGLEILTFLKMMFQNPTLGLEFCGQNPYHCFKLNWWIEILKLFPIFLITHIPHEHPILNCHSLSWFHLKHWITTLLTYNFNIAIIFYLNYFIVHLCNIIVILTMNRREISWRSYAFLKSLSW